MSLPPAGVDVDAGSAFGTPLEIAVRSGAVPTAALPRSRETAS